VPLGIDNIVNNRKFSTLASSIIIISKLNNLDSGKALPSARHTIINNLNQFRSASNATPNNLDSIINQASNNLTVKTVLSKNKQKQERVHKNAEIKKPNYACSTHSSCNPKNILQVPPYPFSASHPTRPEGVKGVDAKPRNGTKTVKNKSINSLGMQGNADKKKF